MDPGPDVRAFFALVFVFGFLLLVAALLDARERFTREREENRRLAAALAAEKAKTEDVAKGSK